LHEENSFTLAGIEGNDRRNIGLLCRFWESLCRVLLTMLDWVKGVFYSGKYCHK
jgi:hypothetical protein